MHQYGEGFEVPNLLLILHSFCQSEYGVENIIHYDATKLVSDSMTFGKIMNVLHLDALVVVLHVKGSVTKVVVDVMSCLDNSICADYYSLVTRVDYAKCAVSITVIKGYYDNFLTDVTVITISVSAIESDAEMDKTGLV